MDANGVNCRPRVTSNRPKLTLYHVLVVGSTSIFGFFKAWLPYNGHSTVPNTLDWLYGVVFFLLRR
ncbi:hypothetical protein CC1G_00972 [Coprinopsis cinerea okayama7|uniref:Uncharacterized protein n=1 Tax=Coprinopsis cinerea (strain Okayama-7 / 130 / ATCC MYA-4618 / FGSC 9003) TaxID=240176 RepID=A8N997_COPC7|nr:hypothetical protein CC1G_00972 [Coprinopsis cinerea okayama7\|eukprot:XP_001831425.2 hypothetical protein CC1G_00972 [Coprinopsis cinerea okayama7\